MADDPRTYIEQTKSRAVDYTGADLSPDQMATEFARWDVQTRVAALQEMRAESDKPLSIEQAAEQYRYESGLRKMHQRLLKVGR